MRFENILNYNDFFCSSFGILDVLHGHFLVGILHSAAIIVNDVITIKKEPIILFPFPFFPIFRNLDISGNPGKLKQKGEINFVAIIVNNVITIKRSNVFIPVSGFFPFPGIWIFPEIPGN